MILILCSTNICWTFIVKAVHGRASVLTTGQLISASVPVVSHSSKTNYWGKQLGDSTPSKAGTQTLNELTAVGELSVIGGHTHKLCESINPQSKLVLNFKVLNQKNDSRTNKLGTPAETCPKCRKKEREKRSFMKTRNCKRLKKQKKQLDLKHTTSELTTTTEWKGWIIYKKPEPRKHVKKNTPHVKNWCFKYELP